MTLCFSQKVQDKAWGKIKSPNRGDQKVLDSQEIVSEFERTLRARYAEGKADMETFRALLAAYQDELDNQADSKRRTSP